MSSLAPVGRNREYRAFLLIMVLSSLATSSTVPLVSIYLVSHLHVALSVVGLFFAGQALPGFALGLWLGRQSDRWNSRLPTIRAAVVWLALGWLVFTLSPVAWLSFAVAPLFLSAGGAIMGQTFAALHDAMTRNEEQHPGLINTTVRTGWSLGYVFGPLVGSGLAASLGFRAAFLAATCLYLLCLIPLVGLRVEVASSRRDGDDATAAGRTNLLLYTFAGLCMLVMCGNAIKTTYLPIDVTTHLGGTVGIYGTIVAVSPIVELVAMPVCGVLSLRVPLGRLMVAGLVVATVEYFLLSFSSALWQLYITQAMDAWVIAVVMGLGLTYAQELSPNEAGLVSGIVSSSYGVAVVTGNVIGSASVPLVGVPHVFFIATALCAASLGTFLWLDRASRRGLEPEGALAPTP